MSSANYREIPLISLVSLANCSAASTNGEIQRGQRDHYVYLASVG